MKNVYFLLVLLKTQSQETISEMSGDDKHVSHEIVVEMARTLCRHRELCLEFAKRTFN
jgi:hypothetical protein